MPDTPPLHPLERELLEQESTLVVTIASGSEYSSTVTDALAAMTDVESGSDTESTPTISFESYDDIMKTFTPRALDLIEAVRREEPESINEAARVVDRDVKNVHDELTRLAQLGVIYFEQDGQRKRPVVWFDDLVISLPVAAEHGDTTPVAP